jgi:hypothetical protein
VLGKHVQIASIAPRKASHRKAEKSVILHDRRLAGSAPIGRGITTIRLDGSTSLVQAFSAIKTLVRLDGVHNLYILCHGYAGESQRGQVCGDMGGERLELGREGLTHTNVARWMVLRGCLANIVVHSCGAADTLSALKWTPVAPGARLHRN